jgi:hypothetical protein
MGDVFEPLQLSPVRSSSEDAGFIGPRVEETEARINRKYRKFSKVFVKSALKLRDTRIIDS